MRVHLRIREFPTKLQSKDSPTTFSIFTRESREPWPNREILALSALQLGNSSNLPIPSLHALRFPFPRFPSNRIPASEQHLLSFALYQRPTAPSLLHLPRPIFLAQYPPDPELPGAPDQPVSHQIRKPIRHYRSGQKRRTCAGTGNQCGG